MTPSLELAKCSLDFSVKTLSYISTTNNCAFSPINIFFGLLEMICFVDTITRDKIFSYINFDFQTLYGTQKSREFGLEIAGFNSDFLNIETHSIKFNDPPLFGVIRLFNGSIDDKSHSDLRLAKINFRKIFKSYAKSVYSKMKESNSDYVFLKDSRKALEQPDQPENFETLSAFHRFEDFYINELSIIPRNYYFANTFLNKHKKSHAEVDLILNSRSKFESVSFPSEAVEKSNSFFKKYFDFSDLVTIDQFKNYSVVHLSSFYFQGVWGIPFKNTFKAKFFLFSGQKIDLKMMSKKTTLILFENDDSIYISMSMKLTNIVFEIIMPKEIGEKAFLKVRKEINYEKLLQFSAHGSYQNINLTFPKFIIDNIFPQEFNEELGDVSLVHRQKLKINKYGINTEKKQNGNKSTNNPKNEKLNKSEDIPNAENEEQIKQIIFNRPFLFVIRNPESQILIEGSFVCQ